MLLNCGFGRRLLRVPWTPRRSNQSILKELSPEYSLEGLMLKLKLQYFGHLVQRTDSFEKTLMLGKIEGGRRRGWQRMRWMDGWHHQLRTGKPGVLQSMGLQRVGHDWVTELNLKDWVCLKKAWRLGRTWDSTHGREVGESPRMQMMTDACRENWLSGTL